MNERKYFALVGLFVLGALAALGTLIVKFGESSWLFSTCDSVAGIKEGTQVMLSGVTVGRVTELSFNDPDDPTRGVVAKLQIDKKYRIPMQSTAVVSPPLMGQATIDIRPPAVKTKALPVNGGISGEVRNPLETILPPNLIASVEKTTVQIGELAEAMKPAATAVKDILEQRTITDVEQSKATTQPGEEAIAANMFTAVERLHNVLAHIEAVLGDPGVQSNFRSTFENLSLASEDIKIASTSFKEFTGTAVQIGESVKGLAGKLDTTLDTTHHHIDTLGKSLIVNSDKLSDILDHMNSVGRDLSEGEGTLGMLLRDPKFHQELMLTVQRLGNAASELTVLIKQWQKDGLLGMR